MHRDFLLPTEGSSDPLVIGYPVKANKNAMTYPTKEQVEKAELEDLVRWNRFLPSPSGQGQSDIIKDIMKRIEDLGGITPEVSKSVGWSSNENEKSLIHIKLFEDFIGEGKVKKVNEISKARLAAVKRVKELYPTLDDKDANQLALAMDLHFSPDWKRDSDVKLRKFAKATAEQTDTKLE